MAAPGFDPERIEVHDTWQELAAAQNVRTLDRPDELGGLLESEDEVDEFLAVLRDPDRRDVDEGGGTASPHRL
jgi:hypothetical protein